MQKTQEVQFGDMSSFSKQRAATIKRMWYKSDEEYQNAINSELREELNKICGESVKPTKHVLQQLWPKYVTDYDSSLVFLRLMYPEYGEYIHRAYAHMFQRAAKGEIDLGEQFIKKNEQKEQNKWDLAGELEQLKLKGQINLANKNMEELLKDQCNEDKEETNRIKGKNFTIQKGKKREKDGSELPERRQKQ